MPRSSDGTFSLVPGTLVNTGDTLLVSQHNPGLQDIESAITGSLDRDGKGGMRAPLSMGANRITGLADGVNDTDAATVGQLPELNAVSVPLGAVIDFWGATPPSGFMYAAGQAISRITYADLFAIIGTVAGNGNGSTTFNLPDYRGRIGAGRDDMGSASAARLNTLSSTTLGATGGAQTHTLTSSQMPAHTHTVTDPGHSHTYQRPAGGGSFINDGNGISNSSANTGSETTGITLGNTGGGAAHNNVQPTIITNKIMRVI